MEELQADLCPQCKTAKASSRKSKLCGTCHKRAPQVPKATGTIGQDIIARAALAKTTEDWQKLAAELAPIMTGILNGEVKATAAQASLIKDIMNRAFGKPTASQESTKQAAGVIILPVLDTGKLMHVCPQCGYDATKSSLAT